MPLLEQGRTRIHTRREQARIIAAATGGRGPNCDYLYNTAAHLAELGLPDPEMEALAAEVRKLST